MSNASDESLTFIQKTVKRIDALEGDIERFKVGLQGIGEIAKEVDGIKSNHGKLKKQVESLKLQALQEQIDALHKNTEAIKVQLLETQRRAASNHLFTMYFVAFVSLSLSKYKKEAAAIMTYVYGETMARDEEIKGSQAPFAVASTFADKIAKNILSPSKPIW